MKFPHFELSTRLRNDTKSALLQADFISVSQQTDILVFQTRKKQFKEQFDCVKEISETFQCEEIWTYICRSHRRWPRCWRQLELYRLKIVKKIRQNTFENKFWKVKNRLLMPRMTFRVCPYWATSSMNDSRAWKRKSCVSVYQKSRPWYLNDSDWRQTFYSQFVQVQSPKSKQSF